MHEPLLNKKAKNMEFTFEQLPQAVNQLYCKLESIEKLLIDKAYISAPEPEMLLTVKDAATFLSLSVPTIYGLISKKELPVMKRSKRCYFSKLELMNYLKQGRKKTFAETGIEAQNYINNKAK